jgi:phosphate transport system permease protein
VTNQMTPSAWRRKVDPRTTQRIAQALIWLAGGITLLILVLLVLYILWNGIPQVNWGFLSGKPMEMGREGGILPTIVGTIVLTLLAVIIATPFGVGTAIYLVEYTRPSRTTDVIRFGSDALAGIPSIVYGLFGFVFFVITLNMGWSILSGALTLAIMILPTIVRTSEEALRAVPDDYREVSLSLGASRWGMVTSVVLPAALPAISTGVVLGMGRCVGETAAVILTAGSSLRLPTGLHSPVRTMSVHFYILAREGISDPMAWGTGAVLVLSILAINVLINWLAVRLARRGVKR